ncbi:hypothetical protein MBGDN05_00620 [Thermoplasmatales archaeon SCGC AB-539-N05]|nr:hypothetical protein MBGDN05_00620 [Thermoplasmatales archaeon SCGC AB-539-N05]
MKKVTNALDDKNVESEDNVSGIIEDDLGHMLYKLELLDESYSYYKAMIDSDLDQDYTLTDIINKTHKATKLIIE